MEWIKINSEKNLPKDPGYYYCKVGVDKILWTRKRLAARYKILMKEEVKVNIQWLSESTPTPLQGVDVAKIVVWKDGTYKQVEDGITYEFENDKNWLVTIPVNSIPGSDIKEKIEQYKKILEAGAFQLVNDDDTVSISYNAIECVLVDFKRYILEKEKSNRSVDVEELADFIEANPNCKFDIDNDTG